MHIFKILFISLVVVFPLTGNTQDFNFDQRTVMLKKFDTTDYCCIKTKTADLFFQKEDFIRTLNSEALKNAINSQPKPVICIGEQLDNHCKSEINTLINQSNLPYLNQKIAELLLTGNGMVRLKNQENFMTEIHAKTQFRHKAIELREVVVFDSASQKVLHTSILPR